MTGADLRDLTFSFRAARAVMAAVATGVVDAIADAPRTAAEVARDCGLAERGASALLEALAALGLVDRGATGYLARSRATEVLTEKGGESRRHVILHDLWHQGLWARLEESLRSGRPLADRSADPFFSDPEVLVRFLPNLAEAMLETSREESRAYAERLALPGAARLLDLGGGAGSFSCEVARRHTDAEVVLLDLPSVAARAERGVAEAGLAGRVQVRQGDFLETPLDPEGRGYDRVLLARVLMGLDDETAGRLLLRARDVLRPGGRLDLLELRRSTGGGGRVGALLDLDMLLLTGGSVRTGEELERLCASAGLRPTRVQPLGGTWTHLEVAP